jgi:hypothetical protein
MRLELKLDVQNYAVSGCRRQQKLARQPTN